jgi:hypothetical protein
LRNHTVINALLIGLGNIGIRYDIQGEDFVPGQTMTHAKALIESSNFHLGGFTDNSPERLATAKKVIRLPNIKNEGNLIGDSTFDLVVIAVNTTQHANVVESLIHSPKILVLEKPGGSNSVECTRISIWALENRVLIFVNYFRRYLSNSINSRAHLAHVNTGRFISAEINAYGTPLNIHSHFIDLGFFLTGQRIFCDCTEKLKSQVGDSLVAFCNACNASFRLSGIGRLKEDVNAKFEFELIQILISQDGRRIDVRDKAKQESTVFECDFLEYQNYQRVFYEKVAAMLSLDQIENCYLGLKQANWAHLFLESVE